MKRFNGFLSVLLLAAFSFVITPQELLHELTQHTDTHDPICGEHCNHHLGMPHQHCDALQLSSPPFYNSVHQFTFSFEKLQSIQSVESTSSYQYSFSPFLFFRGPPSLI